MAAWLSRTGGAVVVLGSGMAAAAVSVWVLLIYFFLLRCESLMQHVLVSFHCCRKQLNLALIPKLM